MDLGYFLDGRKIREFEQSMAAIGAEARESCNQNQVKSDGLVEVGFEASAR